MTLAQALDVYEGIDHDPDKTGLQRWFARNDRFYLLAVLLGRHDAVSQWIYERCREVEAEPDNRLDLWSREHYKDLADDTPILTANRGWVTHGDLCVGDQVYSPAGAPVSVIALSDRYSDSECYRLMFSDGASIVAGAGHLWRVRSKIKKRISGSKTLRSVSWSEQVISTCELPERADIGVLTAPISGCAQQLPVDPYVMGAWLGDGSTGSPRLTAGLTDADEMQSLLEARGINVSRTVHSNAVTLRLGSGIKGIKGSSDVANGLKMAGVYLDKHIPTAYQLASVHQRMMLLRGIMDTDGHCSTRGTATFVNANCRLARDVYSLAAGLALRPRMRAYDGYWQVSFQAHKDRNPFCMVRKAARAIEPSAHRNCRDVVSIERIPSVPTRCIQVEGGMYVAGHEFIPTHNSTVVTFAGAIQQIIRDPEVTIGIFSHTRPIAKAFLKQIKREFESNETLKSLFSDILWQFPEKQAPQWSEDGGLIVKRQGNPKEATLEAWGLVDGQPTSKHYRLRIYDDVVTRESVATPDQVSKTTDALDLSHALGSDGGKCWYVGTRYSFADTYQTILDRKAAQPRIYPATHDGTRDGNPVLFSAERWNDIKLNTGDYVLACQYLQNPTSGTTAMFNREWLRYYETRPETVNIYIMVDPASSRKKSADSTAMAVIAVDTAGNKYLVDGFRHKMNLAERWTNLRNLWKRWSQMPGVQSAHVGYEKYGMQSDIEHFESEMERERIAFPIRELNWTREGNESKADRVQRLVPDLKQSRFWLPSRNKEPSQRQQDCIRAGKPHLVGVDIRRKDHEGRAYSVIDGFIEEFNLFPFCLHDDFLDACSRIYDMDPRPPVLFAETDLEPNYV